MELNENILQIITRQLNNEATQDEQAELSKWLGESDANRQEYDAYVKIWDESANIALQHQFDTGAAWEKLQEKLQPAANVVPMRSARIFTLKRFLVAAVILFAVATAVYVYTTDHVPEMKTIAALDANKKISLPDGSVITLRKGSTLSYPENFGKDERKTELKGEAYFEVQHDEKKPFRVYTENAVVEVLGTAFLVRNVDSLDEVVVSIGKVRFAEKHNENRQVILIKDQKANLIHDHFTRDTVLNTNFIAWENGHLVFSNATLDHVVEDISHYYNVKITMAPDVAKEAGNITIKAEFKQDPVEQVMDEIQLMTGLKIKRENNIFVISR